MNPRAAVVIIGFFLSRATGELSKRRWTLEEGLAKIDDTSNNGASTAASAPDTVTAAPLIAGAPAAPSLPGRGSEGKEGTSATAPQGEAPPMTSAAAAAAVAAGLSSPGEDRWGMDDGAADLAERGVELEKGFGGTGPYLPLPSSSASFSPSGSGGGRRGRKRSRQALSEKEQAEVKCLGRLRYHLFELYYFRRSLISVDFGLPKMYRLVSAHWRKETCTSSSCFVPVVPST